MGSFAYFSDVETGRDVSSLMISVHLFGGLPLPLFFSKSPFSDRFTKLSLGSLYTCLNHFCLLLSIILCILCLISAFWVFYWWIFCLITWCWGLILGNYFQRLTASTLVFSLANTHVSAAYIAMGNISAYIISCQTAVSCE